MKVKINTVEDAYQAIGRDIASFPNGRAWDLASGRYDVYSIMVSCKWWLENNGVIDKKWNEGDEQFNALACDAALFLRDNLLKTTGQRIWGLTFTLFPDGKFRIEYDYDKPEGYEETDETIEVDLNRDISGQSSGQ